MNAAGFAREVKFVIDPVMADQIRKWARTWLAPDPHGETYRVHSLYFDSADFDVLNRNGSFGRGKYRIRRYDSSDGVFLERKLKTDGKVGKKRTQVAFTELPYLEQSHPDPEWPGYWYHRRILARRLHPVCEVSYLRTARIGATPKGTIRLTMDDEVAATPVGELGFDLASGQVAVPTGGVILELKYREKPPLFQQLVERFNLIPHGASKYRSACAALGLGVLQHA